MSEYKAKATSAPYQTDDGKRFKGRVRAGKANGLPGTLYVTFDAYPPGGKWSDEAIHEVLHFNKVDAESLIEALQNAVADL